MPRNVAMGITGHRTEAVYRRYDIVSEKEMKLAASRMDGFFKAQRKDQKEKDMDAKRGTSVVRHSDRTLSRARRARVTFCRISDALAVQMKGLGSRLCWET